MPRSETFDREKVVKDAMQIFWEKGYNGTSMQDIVDATGLNRSSIYNSFGSKRSLYLATLDLYEREGHQLHRKVLLKSRNPLEAIKGMLNNVLIASRADTEGKGCFIMNCKTELGNMDDELNNWLFQNQEESVSLFRDLVSQGQEEGIINTLQDAHTYAYYLYNTFQGLRMTGMLTKDREVLQGILENTMRILK